MPRSFTARIVVALVVFAVGSRGTRADEPKDHPVLESKGYFIARSQAQVGPAIGGLVAELLIEEGQKVKKGEVLARLEDTLARQELRRAEAKLVVARARLALLKAGSVKQDVAEIEDRIKIAEDKAQFFEAQILKATREAERIKYRTDAKEMMALAQQWRVKLETIKKGRPPEESAIAEAECQEAEAELNKARFLLDALLVRAPFEGTVLAVKVAVGTYVNPLAFGAPGYVCELANLHPLEVEVDVQERDLSRVFVGQRCQVRSEAFPKVVHQGKVIRLNPVANRAKGTVTVRIGLDIPAPDDSLRPDMAALVTFLKTP